MRIRNVVHKGLRRLYLDDDSRGLPAESVDKLRKMLGFLQDMEEPCELALLPRWKVHELGGDRKGTWSLSVTPNWRLTFRIDVKQNEITDVDYEDYH